MNKTERHAADLVDLVESWHKTGDPAPIEAYLVAADPNHREQALQTLKGLANDARWRMREAVCFGLWRLMATATTAMLHAFESWIADSTLLELRAVAVSLAEPALLEHQATAITALTLHKQILDRVIAASDRKAGDFKVLRKALGFTVSVVVCALPDEGFDLLGRLATQQDRDVRWIVQQNLKKNRLLRSFPERVRAIQGMIG